MRPLPENEVLHVYRQSIRPLYAFISRRVGGDTSLAEDLVQETWMRALDDWPAKGIPTDPVAWLVRVARNTLVSHFRRIRPHPMDPTHLNIEDDKFSPVSPEVSVIVGWGMARLRRSHADILEAFYFEGKTVQEIAAERDLSERAVEGRLRRARIKLKAKLNRMLVRPAAASNRAGGETEDARPTRTS